MIEPSVFSSCMTILEEHYGKNFSPTLLGIYLKQFSERLNTHQFQAACEQVMMNEKFFPPLQTFIDYGKGSADDLSRRPEYQVYLPPPNYDPDAPGMAEARDRARKIIANKVESLADAKAMPKAPSAAEPGSSAVTCNRLNAKLMGAGLDRILRAEALKSIVQFAQVTDDVELIYGQDQEIVGVRPVTEEVRYAS